MCLTSLTRKDCAHAAPLHQAVFYRGWTEKDFQDFLKDPCTFGLKIQNNGNLCGYILWREIDGEAELLTLVVSPPFQRRGLGNRLLSTLFEHLKTKGISKLFLEVAEDNSIAQSFYIKNGFILLGKRPQYYSRKGNTFVDGLNFFKTIEKQTDQKT